MKYKAILFDLDGTLLPVSNEDFESVYMKSLAEKIGQLMDPKPILMAMWQALDVMIKDETDGTNEMVFYAAFKELIGEDAFDTLYPLFDDYYMNEFEVLKTTLDNNDEMIEAIKTLKEKGYELVVATNPMFPEIAVTQRIAFSGLNPNDFKYVSNFHKHTRCKPDVGFYKEVLFACNLKPEECLMVGNDMHEDVVVKDLGMDAWIIEDYIINTESHVKPDWRGTRKAFFDQVKEVL